MKLRPSDRLRAMCSNRPAWEVCVDVIADYVRTLDVSPDLFDGGDAVPVPKRFLYFAESLRKLKDERFRRDECHPALFDVLRECGIRDDEVLWWYIWEFLGYRIPRTSVCRLYNPDHDKFDYPHCAPFDYVSDMFFDVVGDSIAFANRTGGKTSNVAILNHLDMAFKPLCEVGSAGATLVQGDKVYGYFTGFHKHPTLATLLEKDPTKSKTLYRNGSFQEVVTGSVKGFNSPHPQKARVDEVELIEWDVLQEAFSMVMTKAGIKGQLTLLSTRKWDTGSFQRLLDESERMGMKVYCWCIYEVLQRCTRLCEDDPEHGTCPIVDECGGIAHHCGGFYDLDDWIRKSKILGKETKVAQWFNRKPSRDILVYGEEWKEEVHYREWKEVEPELGPDRIVMSAIDFGSSPGHDFVYQKSWVDYSDLLRALEELEPGKELYYKLKFFVFYEYRAGRGTMAYHSARIKDSPEYREGEVIFADPSAKQARIDLMETYKIDTYAAVNEVVDGIDSVRNHLEVYRDYADGGREKSNLYIVKGYLDKFEETGGSEDRRGLLGTHEEFDRYKYPKQQDGKVVRKIPVSINDHGLDCIRYNVHTAYGIIMDLVVPVEDDVEGGYWADAGEV